MKEKKKKTTTKKSYNQKTIPIFQALGFGSKWQARMAIQKRDNMK